MVVVTFFYQSILFGQFDVCVCVCRLILLEVKTSVVPVLLTKEPEKQVRHMKIVFGCYVKL
jgi:hypothetical protein